MARKAQLQGLGGSGGTGHLDEYMGDQILPTPGKFLTEEVIMEPIVMQEASLPEAIARQASARPLGPKKFGFTSPLHHES